MLCWLVNRDENLRIEDKLLVSAESSHVLEYQYDERGRLGLVKYNGENVEIYRYNQLGQRVFSHVANSDKLEYRYNDLGQLVRAGETTYTYDEDGDLSEKNSPEGITRYEYLKTGQLCEVHLPDETDIEYRFDKSGFRTAKYINGQLVQRYKWKDLTTLTAVEDTGGISKFHYNEHGRVMGMIRNGQVSLFATDQLGSIFTVADSSGNSVQEILYYSFGRRVYNSDPEHDLVLGFGGGLYDSDTGLIHFGYREYDPVIGRFISPDPLGYDGGDVDVYGYCLDDPINFVDRDGLQNRTQAANDEEDENSEAEGQETQDDATTQKDKKNQKSESSEDNTDENKKDNNGYVVGAGLSYAIPGIEGSIGIDAAYLNEDEAAVYLTSGVKGSSGLGFSADLSAGTHNATKAEDLEGSSTTASAGATIPGTPLSVGYSKEISKSSTVDKANLSIGAKVNPLLLPEVSGGRSNSKKIFTFNPPFDEMGEAARKVTKPIDKNLKKQMQSRETKPILPPRTSVRKR